MKYILILSYVFGVNDQLMNTLVEGVYDTSGKCQIAMMSKSKSHNSMEINTGFNGQRPYVINYKSNGQPQMYKCLEIIK